jgi:hypothetical protein
MRADSAEMSWDANSHKWLVRVRIGDEVIRRHCKESKETDDQTLRTIAEKTVRDEGYEIDTAKVTIVR